MSEQRKPMPGQVGFKTDADEAEARRLLALELEEHEGRVETPLAVAKAWGTAGDQPTGDRISERRGDRAGFFEPTRPVYPADPANVERAMRTAMAYDNRWGGKADYDSVVKELVVIDGRAHTLQEDGGFVAPDFRPGSVEESVGVLKTQFAALQRQIDERSHQGVRLTDSGNLELVPGVLYGQVYEALSAYREGFAGIVATAKIILKKISVMSSREPR